MNALKNLKTLFPVFAAVATLVLSGCDSVTSKSLCEEATGSIEGITGIYRTNMRNPDTFGVDQLKVRIVPEDGKRSVMLRTEGDDGAAIHICNIGGVYVAESHDEKNGGYLQSRMFISQVGLHFNPLLFDKISLDGAGVPNKVVVVPESARKVIGEAWSARLEKVAGSVARAFEEDGEKVLFVDNTSVPAMQLLQHAKASSIGFTLYRD